MSNRSLTAAEREKRIMRPVRREEKQFKIPDRKTDIAGKMGLVPPQ
jgi:hypothetical protein